MNESPDIITSNTKALLEYLKKQQENQNFFKSVEIGATFFLISFFLFFAIRPTLITISSLIGENKSKEILSTQMRSKINDIILAQDNFSKVQERYSVIDNSLPDSPKYSNASVQLNAAAQQSSLDLGKINFNVDNQEADKNNPNLGNYSVSINTRGYYPSIIDFLAKILNNRRIVDFTDITLSNSTDRNGEQALNATSDSRVNLNFSANLFYWKNQK